MNLLLIRLYNMFLLVHLQLVSRLLGFAHVALETFPEKAFGGAKYLMGGVDGPVYEFTGGTMRCLHLVLLCGWLLVSLRVIRSKQPSCL